MSARYAASHTAFEGERFEKFDAQTAREAEGASVARGHRGIAPKFSRSLICESVLPFAEALRSSRIAMARSMETECAELLVIV